MGPIPSFVAAIALAFGFVPKIIDFVKSIFGLNKDVDKEIKNQEKDYEKNTRGTAFDTDTEEKEQQVKPEETPPEQQDAEKMNKGGMVPDRGNVTKMNKGGEVPGQGNTDTVPAMLTPGEFVLTKDAVNQVGADTLYGMNAAAGGVGKPSQQPKAKRAKKKKMKTSTVGTMMNMGGLKMGGMTNNMSYMGEGGMANVQYMKLGGMVKNFASKSPQARLLRFAADQIKKSPVGTPISKAFKKLKMLGGMASTPSTDMGDPSLKGETIPNFSVIAPGGRAKEQTLGVRR